MSIYNIISLATPKLCTKKEGSHKPKLNDSTSMHSLLRAKPIPNQMEDQLQWFPQPSSHVPTDLLYGTCRHDKSLKFKN